MKTKFRLIPYSVAVLALTMLAASCSSKKETAAAAPEVVRGVSIIDIRTVSTPDGVESVGTVRAAETTPVAAQIMGTVTAVAVHEGDRVRRGQVLLTIDDAQMRASLERAQAAVNGAAHEAAAAEADSTLASSTLKRYQQLFEQKAVSPQEFDEVKARAQAATAKRELAHSGQAQAKAALAQARTTADYTRVRAPFDGVVTDKKVEMGTMAVRGMPLLTLERSGRFRLEANVDEDKLHFIKPGQTATVKLDSLDQELPGKVVQIVPAADPASRSFIVKIDLPANPQIHSGLFGRAVFPHGERQSLLVPRTALVDRGQLQGVYVVGADRVAELRYITLGKTAGDQIEVLSGLQSGDRLVSAPGARDLGGKQIQ